MLTQLCLALSGLALQLPEWERVVQNMYDMFGTDPATVPVLLEFLTVFPEELSGNSKIPVSVSEIACLNESFSFARIYVCFCGLIWLGFLVVFFVLE